MPQNAALMPNTSKQINALQSLGLKNEQIKNIGIRILAAYHRATEHDAANAAGSYAYFEAVKAVRDILCPQGWGIHRQHNLEFTKHPDSDIMLIISSGDNDTGIENGSPKTKNSKGKQTQNVIEQNARQLELFHIKPVVEQKSGPIWMLLYHIDFEKSEMRMEFSLPIKMDFEELKVTDWKERIIFSPIKFDQAPTPFGPDFAPEIEFDIKHRGK